MKSYIKEEENGFSVFFEVPGYKKEDISIQLKGDILLISGKKDTVFGFHNSFNEKLYLCNTFNYDFIKATLENGILHIKFINNEEKIKKIEIT